MQNLALSGYSPVVFRYLASFPVLTNNKKYFQFSQTLGLPETD